MEFGYVKLVGMTQWATRKETEIVLDRVEDYLSQNGFYQLGGSSSNLDEGVSVAMGENRPCVMIHRSRTNSFRDSADLPIFKYLINIDIGDVPSKKDLVDKVASEILAVSPLIHNKDSK